MKAAYFNPLIGCETSRPRRPYDEKGIMEMGTSRKNNNWIPNKQKLTPCVCPRCTATHKKMIFWTGNIPARKFCPACEQIAERDYTLEPYSLGYMDKDELFSC